MVRDFMSAMDMFENAEEKDRPEHWMFDLIMALDAVSVMGEEKAAEAIGAEKLAEVLGR